MPLVSLESAKRQLRLELDDEADDDYINEKIDVAVDIVQDDIQRVIYEDQEALEAAEDETGVVITPRLRQGILMILSDIYENRGLTSLSTLKDNPAYEKAVGRYRIIHI
ncbi:MAG: phage gp6-like head-tail connector protein [Idiomarina sp.]|nr:phage gp6-like head-tail connector protein [Idiomarina sp.]